MKPRDGVISLRMGKIYYSNEEIQYLQNDHQPDKEI